MIVYIYIYILVFAVGYSLFPISYSSLRRLRRLQMPYHSKILYKAPRDCTKPQKIIQNIKISDKKQNINHRPKIFNKSSNTY